MARDTSRRGLLLLDLLLKLEILDLGDSLTACHRVAEPYVDRFEPAGRARYDRDRRIANQVADHDELLSDRPASGGRGLNGHRASTASATTSTAESLTSGAAATPAASGIGPRSIGRLGLPPDRG